MASEVMRLVSCWPSISHSSKAGITPYIRGIAAEKFELAIAKGSKLECAQQLKQNKSPQPKTAVREDCLFRDENSIDAD